VKWHLLQIEAFEHLSSRPKVLRSNRRSRSTGAGFIVHSSDKYKILDPNEVVDLVSSSDSDVTQDEIPRTLRDIENQVLGDRANSYVKKKK
jgi:hypothetical protein